MPSIDDSSDRQQSRYVATFDPTTGDRASEAVVTAIGTVTESDPAHLEPLYDTIDPDALDTLCDHARRKNTAGAHRLRFSYEGFDIDVWSDGQVRVLDPSSEVTVDGE